MSRNDWTPHDGRSFPSCGPGDTVQVRLRNGEVLESWADSFRWANCVRGERDDDIVAWRAA